MPGVFVSSMLLCNQRINDAINQQFDGKTKEDVQKLLTLSHEGGGTEAKIIAWKGGFVTLMFTIINFLPKKPDVGAWVPYFLASLTIFVAMLTGGMLWYFIHKRNRARRELDELIASNLEYWQPISEKLTKIILEAGRLENPSPFSGERQFTRVVK